MNSNQSYPERIKDLFNPVEGDVCGTTSVHLNDPSSKDLTIRMDSTSNTAQTRSKIMWPSILGKAIDLTEEANGRAFDDEGLMGLLIAGEDRASLNYGFETVTVKNEWVFIRFRAFHLSRAETVPFQSRTVR
jgi:hypothetical protein